MRVLQGLEYRLVVDGVSATNAATVGGTAVAYFDTVNMEEYSLAVIATTSDALTNTPSVMKLQHGDTGAATHASNTTWSNISGRVGDTDFTIPDSPTATATTQMPYFAFEGVKCGANLGRYHRLVLSPLTSQTFQVLVFGKRKQAANTAGEANASGVSQG